MSKKEDTKLKVWRGKNMLKCNDCSCDNIKCEDGGRFCSRCGVWRIVLALALFIIMFKIGYITGSTMSTADSVDEMNMWNMRGAWNKNHKKAATETKLVSVAGTDKNGCIKSCTTRVYAEDVRCFAGNSGNAKVTVCHRTGGSKTPCVKICVDQSAVQEHLAHGDFLGNCTPNCVAPVVVAKAATAVSELVGDGKLSLKVIPNPSSTAFNLVLRSASKENINIRVIDVTGRIIEVKNGVRPNSTLQLGSKYYTGFYFAEIMQGQEKVVVRLLKQL